MNKMAQNTCFTLRPGILKTTFLNLNNVVVVFYKVVNKRNNIFYPHFIKKDVIEHLWKIIISDKMVDQYESNLMRRICGLIYFPDKESGEIKLKLLNNK